jgi:hypothetical protein
MNLPDLLARLKHAPAGLPLEALNLHPTPDQWRQIADRCRKMREATAPNARRDKKAKKLIDAGK